MANRLDAQSSTSTPLGISATFTGQVSYVAGFTSVTVFLDTDQDCTLKIWQATDGVNFDYLKSYDLDASVSNTEIHTVQLTASHMKIEVVNGGVAQTHLRLQTILHENYVDKGAVASSGILGDATDVTLVRNSNDFNLDIQRGLDSNKFTMRHYGYSDAIPNGSFADVWNYSGTTALYPFPVAAETFRVKAGGNVNDTAAGTGARTIELHMLTSTGTQVTEVLTLAGASASAATSVTGTRLLHARVITAGTVRASNTGEIIIENSTTGNIVGVIPIGLGITAHSHYTVPLGYTGYLTNLDIHVEVGTNKDADIKMWQRENALTFAAPFGSKQLVKQWNSFQGHTSSEWNSYPKLLALTDIWFEAQGNGAVTGITTDYSITLVKD